MDINKVALQIRTWKITLAKKLKNIEKRTTYDKILEIAEKICPI